MIFCKNSGIIFLSFWKAGVIMETVFLRALEELGTVGFSHYGLGHMLWLGIFLVTLTVCGVLYRRADEKAAKRWRWTLAVLMLANEVFLKQIPLLLRGEWNVNYLPLELCSINIFLVTLHAWKGSKLIGEFLYTVCIPGALAALLFPSWTHRAVFSLMSTHSFTIHSMLALYPALLLIRGDIRPSWKRIPQCMGILLVLAAFAWIVNSILDTNFFFLSRVSKGNPLYMFETMWGNHLYGFPVLIAGVLLVMHLPLALIQKIRKDPA